MFIINQINRRLRFILVWAFFLCFSVPVNAALGCPEASLHSIHYVATSGSDLGDCSSSETPCQTIQYAANQAQSGDTILVAEGVYTYDSSVDPCGFLPEQGKSVLCVVDKALTILGGYSTSNWSAPNFDAHPTIIDGENDYRGVFLLGYNSTTTSLVMEDFSIRDCRAEGPDSPGDPSGFGGGMLVAGARVTLRDITFRNNKVFGQDTQSGAGGAASGAGLAINWSQPGTSSLLERVTFEENQSFGGTGPERGGLAFGALFVNGSITIDHASFTNNQAIAGSSTGNGQSSDGLCADALGGAIGGGGGVWRLHRIVAMGNEAVGGNATQCAGGGFGGAIHIEKATSFSVTDSLFRDNAARGGNALNAGFGAGGGILINNTPATVEKVQLSSNSAIGGNSTDEGKAGAGGGGGLYVWRTSGEVAPETSIVNSVIADNYVALGSTGSTEAGGGGGGIQVQGLEADIIHSTIVRNRLGPASVSGQGLLVLATQGVGPGVANVYYTMIADHTEGADNAVAVLVQEGNTTAFHRGLFASNTKDTNANGAPMPPGTITGLDTMINASSAGFASPGSLDYDYHITSNSPAIDKATNSTTTDDIDGHPRPYGEASDIGADEYVRPKLVAVPQQVVVMVDDAGTTSSAFIEAEYTSKTLSWSAMTRASWLSLNTTGSKMASGQTGGRLYLLFDPTRLDLGTYEADVSITSQDADSTTLQVRMIKVEEVFRNYIPLVLR